MAPQTTDDLTYASGNGDNFGPQRLTCGPFLSVRCGERETNENTNGLLRQYLPRRTDLTQVAREQLRAIVHALM